MVKRYHVSGDEGEKIDPKEVPWWTSCRLGLAILGFFGFINVYALRVNMSVAIVCMVNQTAIRSTDDANTSAHAECRVSGNNTSGPQFQDGDLIWDKEKQGYILGSFFWGYLVTQIPGGWVATKFGGKRVFGWSMFVATVLTFLTPIAAQTSYIFIIVIRLLMGVVSGVCFPAMHALWGNWAPPMELSKLVAFTYAGAQVGIVVTFPLAGVLCQYGFAGGWPSIFYTLGIINFVWVVIWMIFISDSPAQHTRITSIERDYIIQSQAESAHSQPEKKLSVPWLKIMKSMPFYAIVVSNLTSDWGAYTLLTNIPSYMSEVLKFDIASNGLFSCLPYIAFWAVINFSGWSADFLRNRGILSTTSVRKTFDLVGKGVPALLLIGLGYVDCTQPITAIILLTLGVSITGFQYSAFVVNHVDIAPAFAGILFGISNSIASVTGFVSPVVVAELTKEDQSRAQWQIVFYIAAAIYGLGALFYLIFASGELQDWAKEEKEPEEEKMNPIEMKRMGVPNGNEKV
ncbi:hypothetical protein ScPMuIL_001034 [Solemya velum]